MRFVFVLSHTQYYRHFDRAIRQLCAEGHTVTVVTKRIPKPNATDRAIDNARAGVRGLSFELLLDRGDWWKHIIRPVRELINYTLYFRPEHPSSTMARLWRAYFPPVAWMFLRNPKNARWLAQPAIQNRLRQVEGKIPPSKQILEWLKENQPDVVLASPLVAVHSEELEYVKAAKALHIPTVYALASWDNLTTKGTLHVQPDLTLVWNTGLLDEAVMLHDVPSGRIVITGAPVFDYWFEMKASCSREEFCEAAGIDPKQQYVVYLCTSRQMIEDEETLILDLAAELQKNTATRDMILLVRLHPYNELNVRLLTSPTIRVYPEQGDWPDTESAKHRYYDTLHYAKATVGINTSAMIESAIVDIPCVTIIDERYRSWQTDMGHFRHLMNGDFLEVQYSYATAVEAIARILDGQDVKCEQRKRFVRQFIRPHGLQRPASEILCAAVEMAAEGKTAAQIKQTIDSQ